MTKRSAFLFASIAALSVLSGCETVDSIATRSVPPDPSVLRVGITPNLRPFIYKENGRITGIEADFARKLGQALGRRTVFVEIPWDKLIDALDQNKIDVIMSGMTVTQARAVRVNFTLSYMTSGITPLFRRNNYAPAGMLASVAMNQNKAIGFPKNTTSEFFVYKAFPKANKKAYSSLDAAVRALKAGRIDMLLYDAPVIWWEASENEADLIAFPQLLSQEPMAWAVRKTAPGLRDRINKVLQQWEKDGTLQQVLRTWFPNAPK